MKNKWRINFENNLEFLITKHYKIKPNVPFTIKDVDLGQYIEDGNSISELYRTGLQVSNSASGPRFSIIVMSIDPAKSGNPNAYNITGILGITTLEGVIIEEPDKVEAIGKKYLTRS